MNKVRFILGGLGQIYCDYFINLLWFVTANYKQYYIYLTIIFRLASKHQITPQITRISGKKTSIKKYQSLSKIFCDKSCCRV